MVPQLIAQCTLLWQRFDSEWLQWKPPVHWTPWDPGGSGTGDISDQMVGGPVRFTGGRICQPFTVQRGHDISSNGLRFVPAVPGGARSLLCSVNRQDGSHGSRQSLVTLVGNLYGRRKYDVPLGEGSRWRDRWLSHGGGARVWTRAVWDGWACLFNASNVAIPI